MATLRAQRVDEASVHGSDAIISGRGVLPELEIELRALLEAADENGPFALHSRSVTTDVERCPSQASERPVFETQGNGDVDYADRMFRHSIALTLVASSLTLLVAACSSSSDAPAKIAVGGACGTNTDCIDGAFCQQGTYAPPLAGICSGKCVVDDDCKALGSDLFCHQSYGLCAANCDKGQVCAKGGICFAHEYCANTSG
jgi:hypothetical protein